MWLPCLLVLSEIKSIKCVSVSVFILMCIQYAGGMFCFDLYILILHSYHVFFIGASTGTGISVALKPFLSSRVRVKCVCTNGKRIQIYFSSGNLVKYEDKLYVTTLRHCLYHNGVLGDKYVLTWQEKELTYSDILYDKIAEEEAALFVIDVSKAETEILGRALEFSNEPVELGSFVCGVGGGQADNVISGTVVSLDFSNTDFFIDSRTARTGFSGSAVGTVKLFGVVQGGVNASADVRKPYGNLTSVELGYRFVDELHEKASFSPTLTRCISSSTFVQRIVSSLAAASEGVTTGLGELQVEGDSVDDLSSGSSGVVSDTKISKRRLLPPIRNNLQPYDELDEVFFD